MRFDMEYGLDENKSCRKLNFLDIAENIIIISSVIIFMLNYTIVGVVEPGIFSPLKNIVMLAFFALFIYRFFSVSKNQRRTFFTKKVFILPCFVWIVLFFAARLVTFAAEGFQYGIAREIFFEFVFLTAICEWTVGKNVKIDLLAAIFIIVNLLINIVNTYCIHIIKLSFEGIDKSTAVMEILTSLKTYSSYGAEYNLAVLYTNPNSAGIMTGLAILLSFMFIKNKKLIPLLSIYWLYSIYVMLEYESRGAILSFAAACVSIFAMLLLKKLSPKTIISLCLILSAGFAIVIYGIIGYNLNDNNKELTKIEEQINVLSTGRYEIWQYCYISHKDKRAFGTGSAALEKEQRNEYLKSEFENTYGSDSGFIPTTFSVHNGYLATVFITGWIGFIIFIVIMMNKVINAKIFYKRNKLSIIMASIVIFTFMVSNFEALLITSRYYTILLTFIILAWDVSGEKGRQECK